jgi:hypothetical protein
MAGELTMRVHKGYFAGVRVAIAVSIAVLLAAAPAMAAAAAKPAAARYVPTLADYMGVYEALQAYRDGVEKHDQKAAARAFWEDGVRISVPTPGGPEILMSPTEGGAAQARAGQPGPNAGPPAGLALPPGAGAGQPGAGGGRGGAANAAGGAAGGGGVWHLPLDSYIHFESATRATHYEYFLSLYPQPEIKPLDVATMPNASASRNSIAGWPGHYEDIIEKRNGEWRILHRKTMINQK